MYDKVIGVLLVEDDKSDYVLTADLFAEPGARRFDLIRATTYEAALDAIKQCAPDVCLIDYHLGQHDGVELLRELRVRGHQIPAILLTAQDDCDVELEAMQAGAADCLIKGRIDKHLLKRSLRYAIEHARTLEALRASESKYRQIVETAFEGIWMLDAQAQTTYVNHRMAEMLGYQVDEMLRRPVFEFVAEFERAQAQQSFERRKSGIAEQYERAFLRRDSTVCWTLVATNPIYGANGEFNGSLCMVSDITERRSVEESLRKSEERFQLVIRATNDAVWDWDFASEQIWRSENFKNLFSYAAEEVSPDFSWWAEHIHPEDRDRVISGFRAEVESCGQMFEAEYRFRRADGSYAYVIDRGFIARDSAGTPVRMVGSIMDITERKQTEEAQGRLAVIVESSDDAIISKTLDGNVMTWNTGAERMYGYTAAEAIGRHISFIAPPEGIDEIERFKEQLRRGESIEHLERGRVRKDGTRIEVSISISPMKDARGRIVGASTIARDITARKRAEAELRDSEVRYRLMFESNPLPMWVYDYETLRFLTVNDAALHHYGYSRAEFLAMTIKDIRPQEDVPALLANVNEFVSGLNQSGIWRHRKKNGQLIDVEITSHELLFDGRRAELVLANDVTERRRAEAMLRFQKTLLESQSEASLDGILVVAEDGRIISYNTRFVEMWGIPTEVMGSRSDENALKFIEQNLANPQEFLAVVEHLYRHPDETHHCEIVLCDGRIFERYSAPVKSADGEYYGRVWYFRDVTERKQLEDQFRQAQKMESIGLLAGGVAHDFNNLLTAIQGNAQLALRRLGADDPLRQRLDEVDKAAQRAASLTRQLLAFSRRQHLERRVVNLNDTINDIMKMVRRIIGEDVEVLIKQGPDLLNAYADPAQVEQVVMNLAVNARDAMPQGGRLTIETCNAELDEAYCRHYRFARPGRYVEIRMSDTGTGMDAATRTHIFEPFFTTKGVGKGTGLGLAMVYGIVKQHDGQINVYSEPGHGTIFKVYLPVADAQLEEESTTQPLPILGGTETILVAEDEEALRKMLRDVLEGLGYKVLLAQNGEEAVALYRAKLGQIDLLLLDLVMPQMGGREAYERIHTVGNGIPAIFMTGYSTEIVQSRFLKTGGLIEKAGAVLLQKPYTVEELGRKIREALDRHA